MADGPSDPRLGSQPAHLTTERILGELGVESKKTRSRIASMVEVVEVAAGRRLIGRGEYAQSLLIGVRGGARVVDPRGGTRRLTAPYVIDTWSTDERRVSELTVVAEDDGTLLLVDARSRDHVFASVPALGAISTSTRDAIIDGSRLCKLPGVPDAPSDVPISERKTPATIPSLGKDRP